MKTNPTLFDRLDTHSTIFVRDLPESIRIPALDGRRPDEVVRPFEDATIDDLAFAIQGLEVEARVLHHRLSALRGVYELARRRGALGITTITDAFATLGDDGART